MSESQAKDRECNIKFPTNPRIIEGFKFFPIEIEIVEAGAERSGYWGE
jgi:hypothetical protein